MRCFYNLMGISTTCWYYRLGQGEAENVSENTCQLVSACPEYTSWQSVWPCSLLNVDLFKGLTLAMESVITPSSGTADALMHASVCSHACLSGQFAAVLPFVVCNSFLHALRITVPPTWPGYQGL